MESWQPWCQAAGLDVEVPRTGLCSNDSNLVETEVGRYLEHV